MEPIRIDADFIRTLAIIGGIVGAVLGLIALWLGVKRGKTGLGVIALICCIIAGVFSPLVALIVFFIFFWLIRKKPAEETPAETPVEETPAAAEYGEEASDTKAD